MLIDTRYNRQNLIEGWSQEKLNKSRVAVFGSDFLSAFTGISLVALGVGTVELYTKRDEERPGRTQKDKRDELESMLDKLNPESSVVGLDLPHFQPEILEFLDHPDVIVDTTNNSELTNKIVQYGKKIDVPTFVAGSSNTNTKLRLANSTDELILQQDNFDRSLQGATSSGVMGGMIAEEVRKILMPIEGDIGVINELNYSINSPRRFTSEKSQSLNQDLSGMHVLQIGAGALGNAAGLQLVLNGVGRLDIMDDDEVDPTNLNRQIWFYDAVGEKKAAALADKLEEFSQGSLINGLVERLDERSKYFKGNKPDVIIDCVDSFATRAIINYYAVKEGIPLISGGTNPRAGQVSVYVPGETSCLDCRYSVEEALAESRRVFSCKDSPDPSVIMTNQVVGCMMVGETLNLANKSDNEPVKRTLVYDSSEPSRGGLIGPAEPCYCTKPGIKVWLNQVDSKFKE